MRDYIHNLFDRLIVYSRKVNIFLSFDIYFFKKIRLDCDIYSLKIELLKEFFEILKKKK